MKIISLLFLAGIFNFLPYKESVYVGSTPVESTVRKFFGISLTDSIDFMRWKLTLGYENYTMDVEYGLCKPSTPGFSNGTKIAITGKLKKEGNYYYLVNKNKTLSILSINSNLLHLLDENRDMLIGNGGYSYGLSNIRPVKTDKIEIPFRQRAINNLQVFEGRTPCQELSSLLGMNKSPECNKMKWYVILYTDSITHKPSYFLKGGMSYRKETMDKGKWEISRGKDGRTIYTLSPEKQSYSFNLVQVDDNILLFTDKQGNLLVGNEDFSYTLNRRKGEYPAIR